jgi:hypothetical protein
MTGLISLTRNGVMIAAAAAALWLAAPTAANAHKGHHGHHGHGHHGHGHHGHGHHGHWHHRHWRHRHLHFYSYAYGGCFYWRNECAERWGYHTRQYYRCLWRHGC